MAFGLCLNYYINISSHFTKFIKVQESASFPRLVFHEYAAVKELCFVKAIDAYLSRIKTYSGKLSFIKSHEEVVSSTVFEWIRKILFLVLTLRNSNRSASTSIAALLSGSASGSLPDRNYTIHLLMVLTYFPDHS